MASALNVDHLGMSNSTMSLSQEDILAAIAATPSLSPLPAPAPAQADPTAPPRTSNPLATGKGLLLGYQPTAAPSFTSLTDSPEPSEEMLRLKIGEEVYTGLTMPQLIDWVAEGRILENHQVARQHSENWLDAHKVPGLRPVFERLRRERSAVAPGPDSAFGDSSPKKGLFGGLFGKS
jgi:hypothetical protein